MTQQPTKIWSQPWEGHGGGTRLWCKLCGGGVSQPFGGGKSGYKKYKNKIPRGLTRLQKIVKTQQSTKNEQHRWKEDEMG